MDTAFLDALAKNWWAIALRGVLAIVSASLAVLMPGITLAVLLLLFGGYALVDGVFNVIAAVRQRHGGGPSWTLLLEGFVSIAAGIITIVVPGLTALALVYVIAAWAIVTGVLEIIAAIGLRRVITGESWLALSGALSLIFSTVMMVFPGAGALALVMWIAAYAFVFVLTRAVSVGLLALALVVPASGQELPAPRFYQLLPPNYPYSLIRVCSTPWGICAIPVTVQPGTPCQCLAANGTWVPGVCTH